MNKELVRLRIAIALMLIIGAALGGLYVWYTWNTEYEHTSAQALIEAKMAREVISDGTLEHLGLNASDLEKPEYQALKEKMQTIASINDEIRFAYVYVRRDGILQIAVDSEPVDSPDYSEPGQVYAEAEDEYYQPFIDNQARITQPVQDRWGRWVSVLLPITDKTGEVIGVFGIDYPESAWAVSAVFSAARAGLIIVLLVLFLVSLSFILNRNLDAMDNEKNFRSFFDAIDDVLVVADKSGKIVFTNDSATRKLGYARKEFERMRLVELNPRNNRDEAQLVVDDMLEGKRNSCPLPLERKDGTLLPVDTRVWFGVWSGADCLFGISKDLSQEQEATQKFNTIFESGANLMVISSLPDRIFTDVNATFLKRLGYTKDEVVGKKEETLGIFIDQETRDKIRIELEKQGFVHNVEVRIRTKDNGILDGIFFGEVIEIQGNRFLLTEMVDQTERKAAENEVKKKNVELERLNKFMVGRELAMVDLKKQIEKLKK